MKTTIYDDLSRRNLLTYGNGTTVTYLYDIGDELTRITNNTNPSIDINYSSYDNVGNRLNTLVNGSQYLYNYDKLYQLKFVDYPAGQGTDANYYYDCLGSRTSVVAGSTTNYSHNRLNQYDSVGAISYSYDNKGNLTYDGTYTYVYDCENRLTEVKQSQTTIAQYAYDFTGRRVSKTVSGVITKYCYDGAQIIAEYSGGGTLIKKYIYGPGIDEPIMMLVYSGGSESARYYYHFDGLGSVVALSNSGGTVVENYRYDVFGQPNITSTVGNRFMFTGREYDSDTNLYCYRARFYKPSIGRFLQTDPIGYADFMNLYTYCLNNPINWIDPWGLLTEKTPQGQQVLLEFYGKETARELVGGTARAGARQTATDLARESGKQLTKEVVKRGPRSKIVAVGLSILYFVKDLFNPNNDGGINTPSNVPVPQPSVTPTPSNVSPPQPLEQKIGIPPKPTDKNMPERKEKKS